MKKSRKILLSIAALFALGTGAASAAIGLSNAAPSVSEDFNTMWDADASAGTLALPADWRIDRNLTAPRRVNPWSECSAEVMYQGGISLASNAKNGTWNFGAADSDRAIGGLTTTVDGGTRGLSLLTHISNTDPSLIITGLTLSYNIEKYRKGDNPAGFAVQLFTSFDGSKWTAAGDEFITFFPADDATEGASIVPIASVPVEGKALRTHVEPGADIYLAWNISVASGTTANKAQGLALDDILITASFAAEDPDWTTPEVPEKNPSGIYIRGEVNGWGADEDWEFSKLSDTTFELRDMTLSGQFKIGDATWSDACNYGSNGSNIMMDEPYILVAGGTSSNISCGANSYFCKRILLSISENGEATLLLEPDNDATGLTSVYMVGDFNSWNFMDPSGKLDLDAADGLFKGRVSMTPAADGLCHWRLYQRLGMGGAWGLEEDAAESSLSGTLVPGMKHNAALAGGTYDVVFNLANGEYTFTKVSSVPVSMTLSPASAVLTPALPDAVRVLSLNNSLIHYNDQAKMFNDIAVAMGADAVWTKHTLLGKSLATHWEEGDGLAADGMPGAKMLVRSQPWTHIILQEQSSLPRTSPDTFRANVERWVSYIRENCPNPNAVIILPVNWAYAGDWTNFSAFNDIFLATYREVASEFGLVVCPVMSAYQTMFDVSGADGLAPWFQDDRHPTDLSTYMAACMEYGLIMGVDPTEISVGPAVVPAADAADMRVRAAAALQGYVQTVDHAAATIRFSTTLLDEFGMPLDHTPVFAVSPSEGAAISPDGVFTATAPGTYTVSAGAEGFNCTSAVLVAEHTTEVVALPSISISAAAPEYMQNFDSMGAEATAALPEGWRIARTYTPREVGTYQGAVENTMYAGGISLPSNAKNGLWNFGPDDTDRAVGGITTGVADGTRSVSIYARFVNDGRKALENIALSYDIEKYRDGNNAAGFAVTLYTSPDGRNWTSAGSDFVTSFPASAATVGAEIVPMETKTVEGTLVEPLAPGCELFLAWNISVASGTNCAGAPALAIDNFALAAEPEAVPEYKWHIYIDDRTGYDAMGVYAYGDKEIWGAWPGQAPVDEVEIDGIAYKVFGHDEDAGSYNLIVNNWNRSLQLPDVPFVGGRDYYFTATPDKLEEKTLSGIETILEETELPVEYFNLQGIRVSQPGSGLFIRRQGSVATKVFIR